MLLYPSSPSDFRRAPGAAPPEDALAFELSYRPPLAWEPLLAYFKGRAFAGVETAGGGRYLRTAALGPHGGWIAVGPSATGNALRLEVSASLPPVFQPVLARVK